MYPCARVGSARTPAVPLPFPVLAWQYDPECHGGNGFDVVS